MEQKMTKLLQSVILALLLFVLVLSGCTTTQTNDPTANTQFKATNDGELRASNAKYIGHFVATTDEKVLEARFSLLDSSNKYVSADGVGKVRIKNSEGKQIYAGTINVKKEDFGKYTLRLTGEEFEAYVWEIPITSIEKSFSSSGTMYLNFETGNARFEEIDTDLGGLPTYSKEELAELNEQAFSVNAIEVNKKVAKGDFEVTVQRVGFFKPMVTYGEQTEYFRIDMEFKNIGDEKEYFSSSDFVILDNQGNQFEREYGGTLESSDIYPGVKKSGYVLFEKMPAATQTIKLVFELGYDTNYAKYTYEYNIPLI